jgi:hypothetical protein
MALLVLLGCVLIGISLSLRKAFPEYICPRIIPNLAMFAGFVLIITALLERKP